MKFLCSDSYLSLQPPCPVSHQEVTNLHPDQITDMNWGRTLINKNKYIIKVCIPSFFCPQLQRSSSWQLVAENEGELRGSRVSSCSAGWIKAVEPVKRMTGNLSARDWKKKKKKKEALWVHSQFKHSPEKKTKMESIEVKLIFRTLDRNKVQCSGPSGRGRTSTAADHTWWCSLLLEFAVCMSVSSKIFHKPQDEFYWYF